MNECFTSTDANCGCKNKLDIKNICASCASICWQHSKQIWSEDLNTNNLCAQNISTTNKQAQYITATSICAQNSAVANEQVQSATIDNLCATIANITDLCVTNLQAPNWKPCNTHRAYLALTANASYTLGDSITFDAIIDDPSNMVSISPTRFTVPLSGYWQFNISVSATDLAGTVLIAGVPVAYLSVFVNGISRQSSAIPFLSFATNVKAALACDLILNAGDIVTATLDIQILTAAGGLTNYVGTMLLNGGPLASTVNPSSMNIVLLTELCAGDAPITCIPCQPVQVTCEPVTNHCPVVKGPECDPCNIKP